uniref:Uncharacterized protein n=1 Tax=Tenebrio molitor TaxID=7067 RepID=A0A8J6H4A9_TENMO|nr:hypothetical protein GEV33_015075 [Tenebrio molitor]KAH0807717.1 hypothetical protein GEV33_015074 [Tenebrio molitor]
MKRISLSLERETQSTGKYGIWTIYYDTSGTPRNSSGRGTGGIADREIEETEVTARLRGQLYEVSATATLPALKDPEEFSCELRIPQANYTVRRETVFYPGKSACLLFCYTSARFTGIT